VTKFSAVWAYTANTGRASPATPPFAAPVIAPARFLSPVKARLLPGGYGAWQWTARGASRFLVQSYAYAGGRVVDVQRVSTTGTSFQRRLLPGLTYYGLVRAVANDGEQTAPRVASRGLIYFAARAVQRLRAERLPDGRRHWTWSAQPGMRFRLRVIRYAGRRGAVVTRVVTIQPYWTTMRTPAHMTDYLQIWAVDIRGAVSKPVWTRVSPSSERRGKHA
jgi:CubicO group peptidase (beta-lactamase class C family)